MGFYERKKEIGIRKFGEYLMRKDKIKKSKNSKNINEYKYNYKIIS